MTSQNRFVFEEDIEPEGGRYVFEEDYQPEAEAGLEPSSLERKLFQGAFAIPTGVRATPRVALEAPRFVADVADIAAEKIQNIMKPETEETEDLSFWDKLFPSEEKRTPKEELYQPGRAVREMIPKGIQDKYQKLKEIKIGSFPLSPTMEEAKEELKGQMKDPTSFLSSVFGVIPEENIKKIDDLLTPKDMWEKYQQRALEFGIPGALLGGGSVGPAATGFGLGIGDEALEEAGFGEDDRKLAALLFAPFIHKGVEAAKGKIASGKSYIKDVGDAIKSPKISSPTELAAKILSPRMKNINIDQLQRAKAEGINPTLASITEGGLSQFGANNLSQNFLTKSFFDESVQRMTGDIQNAIERKINSISADEFLDLSKITEEDLGTAPFTNPVKTLADSFTEENLSLYETGEKVQNRLNEIKETERKKASKLYTDLKKDPLMKTQFVPNNALLETVDIIKKKQSKGLKSPAKKDLLGQLGKLEDFFIEKIKPEEEITSKLILPEKYKTKERVFDKDRPRQKPARRSIGEVIAQIEDLNSIIDFDENIGNQSKLLIPIRKALIEDAERIMKSVGEGKLSKQWKEAKESYKDYAQTFGRDNPTVFKAQFTKNLESIPTSGKTRSGLQGYLKAFSKSGENEKPYFNLQKKVIEEISGQNALTSEQLSKFKYSKEKVKSLNELKPILQMDAQVLIKDIQDLSNKVEAGITNQLKRDSVRADVLNSLAKGELPVNTLKSMNTVEGIKHVKESLSKPKAKSFLKALEKQKAREILLNKAENSDGTVNLSKINSNLKNPSNKAKLQMLMSKKSFSELMEIAKFTEKAIEGDRAFRNFSQTETTRQNAEIIKKFYSMGKSALAGGTSAAVAGIPSTLLGIGGMYAIAKLYTNPKFINALSEATLKAVKLKKTSKNSKVYNSAVKNVIDIAKSELSEKEFSDIQSP